MLRPESELWNVEEVVIVSEDCVILYKHLIRIEQTGAFEAEIAEEDEQYDLSNQFMCEDTIKLHETGEERRTGTAARLLPNGGATPAQDLQ